MQLHCKNCGAAIPAENVNIHDLIAVCPQCHHIFKFGDKFSPDKVKSRKVKQPDNMSIRENEYQLGIIYGRVLSQDDAKGVLPLTILTLIMSFLFAMNVASRTPIVFAIILGLLTSIFAYILAEAIFNRTKITVDPQEITVRRAPLPLPGVGFPYQSRTLSRDQVMQIFAEETVESREKGDTNRYYHVCAQLPDGNRVILIKGAPQAYALYVAQRLETFLQDEEEEASERLADDAQTEIIADITSVSEGRRR